MLGYGAFRFGSSEMNLSAKNILVVDNNPEFLREIGQVLAAEGHQISSAADVFHCLDFLATNAPDIIFLDYVMPHMTGDDLCRAIRNHRHLQKTYIVIFSPTTVEQLVDFMAIGADACIAKAPLSEMRVHIDDVLREAQTPGADLLPKSIRAGKTLSPREITSELLQRNSHCRLLLQRLSQGIIEIVAGRVVYVNQSGATMLNVQPEEIIGAQISTSLPRGLLNLLEKDNLFAERFEGELSSPVQFNEKQLLVEIFPLHVDLDGNLIILTDITERKRMESVIEAANLTENLGYVFSGIRHEIGNPVNSIKMALSVLQRNLLEYDRKTIAEFLDRSLQEISRIEYLLKALKNYSLFESPVVQAIAVAEFMHDFIALIRNDFEQLGIVIRTLLPDRPLTVKADSRALHHVMLNLVTNAVDALQDTTNPQITISSFLKKDMVLIKVDDNGKGVLESDLQHLFKPFYTSKATGTGLGLAIVRKMLASMDGTVDMESYLGIGTTVTIQLPGAGDEPQQKDPSYY